LLDKHRAAIPITTLLPEEIAAVLTRSNAAARSAVAGRALELAQREFMLADQTRKFWDTISHSLSNR